MDNQIEKKPRKKFVGKDNKYKEEQKILVNKILSILDPESSKSFVLYEVDNNTDKKQEISDLVPEIKKYCKIGETHGVNPQDKCKRPYLSILKTICKKLGYKTSSKKCMCRIDNVNSELQSYIYSKRYFIELIEEK